MKKNTLGVLFFTLLIGFSSLSATPIDTVYAYEDFTLTTLLLEDNSTSVGFGFEGDWTLNKPRLQVNITESLAYPADLADSIVSFGGYIFNNPGSATNVTAKRTLLNPISLGSTFYMSYLASRSSIANNGKFVINGYAAGSEKWKLQMAYDGELVCSVVGQNSTSADNLFLGDKTYLVVIKWTKDGANANMKVKLFDPESTVPSSDEGLTWTYEVTGGQTGVAMDEIGFTINKGEAKIDEFLLGSSWKSVTTDGPATKAYKGFASNDKEEPNIYEGFNYTSSDITADSVGYGWSGKWTYDSKVAGATVIDDYLCVKDSSGFGLNRDVESPMLLGTSSSVYYTSFLAQKDAAGMFRISGKRADGIERFGIHIDADGQLGLQPALTYGATVKSGTSFFANNIPYFVVTKYWYQGSKGHMKIKLFENGEAITEPGDEEWDFSADGASTGVQIDNFRFAFSSNSVFLDEFKVGGTWGSVTSDEVDFGTFVSFPTTVSQRKDEAVKVLLSQDKTMLNVLNYQGVALIYDVAGKQLSRIANTSTAIDISNLTHGIYILTTDLGAVKFVK